MSATSLHNDFAAALLDPDAPAPAQARTHNGSSVRQRFAVYRNNVIVSLVDALADSFPVVQSLVGTDFFRAMARAFVLASPPSAGAHRVLARYGEGFASFIAGFEPAAALPYLADVAALEQARWQAFHAAEDAVPRSGADLVSRLAALVSDPDALQRCTIRWTPSLQIIISHYAVVSLWHAHQLDAADRDLMLQALDWHQPQAALVFRAPADPAQVLVQAIDADGAALIAAMRDGASFSHAWSLATASQPQTDPPQALDLVALIRTMLSEQLIETLCIAPSDSV